MVYVRAEGPKVLSPGRAASMSFFPFTKQEDNVKLPPFQQHEDDDGGTKKWGDCSEGNHAVLGGKGAKPVAEQGDD